VALTVRRSTPRVACLSDRGRRMQAVVAVVVVVVVVVAVLLVYLAERRR
jgi:hypothetical protein